MIQQNIYTKQAFFLSTKSSRCCVGMSSWFLHYICCMSVQFPLAYFLIAKKPSLHKFLPRMANSIEKASGKSTYSLRLSSFSSLSARSIRGANCERTASDRNTKWDGGDDCSDGQQAPRVNDAHIARLILLSTGAERCAEERRARARHVLSTEECAIIVSTS